MPGVSTLAEALKRRADTVQVTFTTVELNGGTTHNFKLDETDSKIDSVDFKPSDGSLTSEALITLVRPIVISGSTDTDYFVYEDSSRDQVDEVLRIENLSVNDSVETFQPGLGQGVPFENQEGDSDWYLTLDELSNTASKYQIRMRLFDV